MSTVTRGSDTVAGVPGVRFATAARPYSPEERTLQRIQESLSGGVTSLPSPTTVAQLAYQSVEVVDGTSYSVITPVGAEGTGIRGGRRAAGRRV